MKDDHWITILAHERRKKEKKTQKTPQLSKAFHDY